MREKTDSSRDVDRPERQAYEPPAILWEEALPQGPNLFAACGKMSGGGELCNSAPSS